MSKRRGCMNGSPPTMPKKALPIALASATSLENASGEIVCCLAATSTQQPWQRRLQLLMTETYKNGGKYSPRLSRRLCRSTESIPLTPMFHTSFHSRRLSVSVSIRQASFSIVGLAVGRGGEWGAWRSPPFLILSPGEGFPQPPGGGRG